MRTCTPLRTCCQHGRVGRVGHRGRDLHAAHHRPRVQHHGVLGQQRGPAARTGRSRTAYSRADGKNAPCIRSACTRSIITASRRRQLGVQLGAHPARPRARPRPAAASAARPARPRRPASRAGRRSSGRPGCAGRRRRSRSAARRSPPSRSRSVAASSSACVGCSWVPSPALTMHGRACPSAAAVPVHPRAPAGAPRRTPGAARSRSRRPSRTGSRAVSRSDSPLPTDEPDALTLIVSALIHLPATSNDTRVRVEFS